MEEFWANLPIGQVTWLVGAEPEAIAIAATSIPTDAPAIVHYLADRTAVQAEVVRAVLDQLETAVLDLFPAWLAAATGIDGTGGANVAAVRALARRLGAAGPHSGPFVADLAERALRRAGPQPDRYRPEVRAAGLARLVAESFGRRHAALLVRVPDDLSEAEQHALVGAGEWLAQRGPFGVWLTGGGLTGGGLTGGGQGAADRVGTRVVALPTPLAEPPARDTPARSVPLVTAPTTPRLTYPAPVGRPHPASAAEQALEAALASRPWAAGRAWNQTYQSGLLTNPIRLDLLWSAERCVVEVDGPEHGQPLQYAADRQRDVRLQLDGYAVLRFTNDQICTDIEAVVAQLERMIASRRVGLLREGS
ncbi:endonuclease domain-containing protein [Micromonospora sp. NBC_01813]|uniref:endonuclease domain-containing protein n=1 Tax=Micromonospora sp. NBC_01813 TaxID=2975988 RepID=UPI002DD7FC0D|nr:DUF559 domain-containing protein [Micromonospora sp. NBC_01813]WSA10189.1 endonuclease domain-containing protein [Micromonospora sp. NBC_01813]